MQLSAQKYLDENFDDIFFPGDPEYEAWDRAATAAEVEREANAKELAAERAAADAAEAERIRRWRAENPPRVVTQKEVDELCRVENLKYARFNQTPPLTKAENVRKTEPAAALEIFDVGDEDGAVEPRQWLLGGVFCRGILSGLISAGAGGKTTFRILQSCRWPRAETSPAITFMRAAEL